MIISLAGLPGSGKSTVKRILAEELGYKSYSMGDLRGQMALARGLTIDELNVLGMTEDFTDKEADDFQTRLGETEDNFVIDGRMSWRCIPKSFKVFLTVNPDEAARRVFAARHKNPESRSDEPLYATEEESKTAITERLASDRERYKKWYGVDFLDKAHYDLVLDTTHTSARAIAERILTELAASTTLRKKETL